MKLIYGPVFSRRLGLSLGLDIIPYKTCSLDCVYCECGKTTDKTIKRKSFIKLDALFDEIDNIYKTRKFEYITFAGSGEPSLNKDIGKIINKIKKKYPNKKVAVLTNGTLFFMESVRKDLLNADIVIPSVDTVNPDTFIKLNNPVKELSLSKILKGLQDFSHQYKGSLWLETLFVKGINDNPLELQGLKEYFSRLKYEKIDINTIDRPPAVENLKPVDKTFLIKASKFLDANEIKRKFHNSPDTMHFDEILEIIKRRPYTINEILEGMKIDKEELLKELNHLEKKRFIDRKIINSQEFIFLRKK